MGRAIRRATAGTGKKLSLELGGKSPFVVFEDADLDSVVEGVVDAIWFNQGQVCCAGSRMLVQEGIADRMIASLRARMEKLRVGDPLDKTTDIGAIIAPVQLQKIRQLCELGVQEGATMWQPSWAAPRDGFSYPPTLFTGVSPSATIAQEEIFGPVLVSMTFRTPAEAVALANNTRYGLAASVWTENINLALDIARQIKAGTVWVNSTNLFDGASGFGGYRESGFGREGGREGLLEYLKPAAAPAVAARASGGTSVADFALQGRGAVDGARQAHPADGRGGEPPAPRIDRTPKHYIGGKQVRPDQGYSRMVYGPDRSLLGEVGEGNRKDIRNAVEAARAASSWGSSTAHTRAQILFFAAENLESRGAEFATRIAAMTAGSRSEADGEVQASISRLFTSAAWCDKYDGQIHSVNVPHRDLTIALHEPVGVVGIACPDEAPLLAFVTLVASAVAMGNTVVAIPSQAHPLAATDLYQVFDTSDVPGGVINIVTGDREELSKVLAAARRRRCDVVLRLGRGQRDGRARVGHQHEADLGEQWQAQGLARRLGRRRGAAAPRRSSQEYLGAVRRVASGGRPRTAGSSSRAR